ncbi:MAG TPA: hypothetical protein DCM54_04130 [Gammaproteobacteria bacterium]|nr:hypothetical protein [Gammaproteobacteria bacterium]|tara:strand:- start:1820 stop:2611 length:792 start_codon:yes stop_codon:yes gene_type:complete
MSNLLNFLAIVLVLYGLLTAFIYFTQDTLLFYPSPSDPAIESRFRENEIRFSAGDDELRGWFIPASDSKRPSLIFYGGNGQELSRSINSITSLGDYNYALVNYRGYGLSTGRPTEDHLKSDALLILDTLAAKKRIDLANTIIMGRSLGTGVAIHVAANREVKGLVLISPFNSIEAIASDIYFYLPVKWLIRHPFRSIDYVTYISAPTLIIKAENDRIIPASYTSDLIDAWRGPLEVVELNGTNHNYIETPQYYDVVRRHLESL